MCYVKKGNFPAFAPKVSYTLWDHHQSIFTKLCIISNSYLAANISDKSLVVRYDDNSTYKKRNKNWNVSKILFFANWSNPDVIQNLRQPMYRYTTKFWPERMVITKKRPDCPLIFLFYKILININLLTKKLNLRPHSINSSRLIFKTRHKGRIF